MGGIRRRGYWVVLITVPTFGLPWLLARGCNGAKLPKESNKISLKFEWEGKQVAIRCMAAHSTPTATPAASRGFPSRRHSKNAGDMLRVSRAGGSTA